MGHDSIPKGMFSIYKIDPDKIANTKVVSSKDETSSDYRRALIAFLTQQLQKNKSIDNLIEVQQYSLMGFVYKQYSKSPWAEMVAELITTDNYGFSKHLDEAQGRIMAKGLTDNSQLSFALFAYEQSSIYAVSCGLGHHCFKRYVVSDFGVTFVSKLIEENHDAIRSMTSSTPVGLTISESHVNRNVIAYNSERDIDRICNSLGLELDENHLNALKIEVRTDGRGKPKKTSADAKCTLKIRQSISLKNLSMLIAKVAEIDLKNANFALSNFQKIEDDQLKLRLEDALVQDIQHHRIGCITITGDEPEKYYFGERFSVRGVGEHHLCAGENPIEAKDLFHDLENTYGLDDPTVRKLITNSILAVHYERSGQPHFCKLKEALTASVQYEFNSYYFLQGSWYKFAAESKQYIDDRFDVIRNESTPYITTLLNNFDLSLKLYNAKNESQYNRALYNNNKVLVSDTVCIQSVEIADVICHTEGNTTLLHNKQRFNGKGSRDVTHQIETSSFVLHALLSSSDERYKFIRKFYTSIKAKYIARSIEIPIGLDEFETWFKPGTSITYVSAYIQDFKESSDSQYAKYVTLSTSKKLAEHGYKLYVASL